MPDLKINVKVDGEEKLKNLKQNLEDVTTGVEKQSYSLADLSKGWVSVGAIFSAMVVSGIKWSDTLKDIQGQTDTFKNAQEGLIDSFGALSASIMDATGVSSAYKSVLSSVTDGFNELAYAISGVNKVSEVYKANKLEDLAWEKERMQIIRKHAKEEEEIDRKKQERQAKADADANVRHQKHLSRLDEIVRKEVEEAQKKAKADEDAYEAELKRLDAMLDSADAIETVTEATREATQAEEEYSQAIQQTASAKKQTETYQSSSNVVVDRGSVRDMQDNGYTAFQSVRGTLFNPMQDVMEDIARTNRSMSRGDN